MAPRLSSMSRYRLAEDVRVEHNDAVHGTISAEFKAGDVTPRSEEEEVALRKLVEIGQAEVIEDPKPRKKEA